MGAPIPRFRPWVVSQAERRLRRAPSAPAVEVVSDRPVGAYAEALQIAKARFNELALELVTGEGLCRGRTDLRAGKVIKIDGVGRRFGGRYYVASAVHRYSPAGDYVTEFVVRRNAS